MRNIKAGDLRHPVTLLEPVVTMVDKRRKVTWTPHAVMAGQKDLSSREYYQAQEYHAEDTVTYTIRWRDDVDATWRLRHGNQIYEISAVNHLGYMRDYLQLKCRTLKGGGA